jgi:hypothetical protein
VRQAGAKRALSESSEGCFRRHHFGEARSDFSDSKDAVSL